MLSIVACSSPAEPDGPTETADQNWDSQDGNPTHATHSLMAEYAIKNLGGELPEVAAFQDHIVEGANLELHELPSKTHEALRLEVGGTNWAADHPEVLWEKARASYAAGDKGSAYFYVGILLHYVQDMGVPAHAFHVIHQSSFGHQDNIEILGFFDFHADFSSEVTMDPAFANPVDYVEWSGQTARDHFHSVFGNATYTRQYFPQAYDDMDDTHWAFLRRREAECARGTEYALRSAALAFAKMR
jgi:hypothetical protein